MPGTNDIAIKVDSLSKSFRLPHDKSSSIKSSLINFRKRGYETQRALENVSFEIKKGEFFGIVGRNGSGKSTLLKTMAGIYTPDRGNIHINGSLVPFIELGVGFNPELTGRENIYLNGALLGFSRKQMKSMYEDIVDFAELHKFMDQKLKNYSSGMQVRLAFSIAIRAQGDILLLDEVLAVGDAAFRQKCNDYFASLKRDKQTIILVSHSMAAIERYCDRALLLENGQVVKVGGSSEVASLYEDTILKEEADKASAGGKDQDTLVNKIGIDTQVKVVQGGKTVRSVEALKPFELTVSIKSKKNLPEATAGISIRNSEGQIVLAIETVDKLGAVPIKAGKKHFLKISPENVFTNGLYHVTLTINNSSELSDDADDGQLFKKRQVTSFTIFGIRRNANSLVHPPYKISYE